MQLISRFLASYTIPCLYFVGHACGLELLIMLIVILIYYIIMACLFYIQKSGEIHLFVFLFCPIARLKVVFDIFEQRCRPNSLILLHTCLPWFASNSYAVSFVMIAKYISTDSNGAADKLGLQFKFSMHIYMLLLVVKYSFGDSLYTNLKWNFNCPVEFQVTYPRTTLISYHTSSTLYFDPR